MSTTTSILDREDTLDINGLAAELFRQAAAKIDVVADTRRLGFYSSPKGQSYLTIDGVDSPFDDETFEQGFRVNEYAHDQLGGRLGIPSKYYDRMRTMAPGLLDTNVSYWFREQPETRLLRMLDGKLRAVLSDRYRRLDNIDLMESILPVFNEIDGLQFHVASLTDTRLYVRAILPTLYAEIGIGDIVQAGVEIRNSEVGAGALAVSPYLWRLVCLNGMVSIAAIRKYHVGRKVEESDELLGVFTDETIKADDTAFFLKVRDIVKAALSEARFEEIIAGLREIASGERVTNPVKASEVLANTYALNENEQTSILRHLIEGGDLSQWGAANALTAAAKDASDFDRVAEMEVLGGRVAALSPVEWGRIARTV